MMPIRDLSGFADANTPSAQLIILLHMGIDLVEDTAFEEPSLKSALLESLLDSMRFAIEWRGFDIPDDTQRRQLS